MKTCINCGAQFEENNSFCPRCGTPCENDKDTTEQTKAHPMKWHNFLMVVMILGGILTIANGLNTMMGSEYISAGYDSFRVYSAFPGLKSCDTFYGIATIALGVFEFIVRSRLRNFRANGPGSLKAMYIMSFITNLIYLGWASSATGISMFNSSSTGSLLGPVLFLIISSIYYSKRSDLFVN